MKKEVGFQFYSERICSNFRSAHREIARTLAKTHFSEASKDPKIIFSSKILTLLVAVALEPGTTGTLVT